MKTDKKVSSQINLRSIANDIRVDIITLAYGAHKGHIAPSLSIVDILTVLYFCVLRIDQKRLRSVRRDRFILSKGHAALALYTVLSKKGLLPRTLLSTYCKDGTLLGTHPNYEPKYGIELSSGSLGHGLSVGIGMAMGLAMTCRGLSRPKVYVLISDAELNEGSTWEAIMFAGHHRVDNLVVIVDDNGLQALGQTEDILSLQPLAEKWKAFGWFAQTIDGNSVVELRRAFEKTRSTKKQPSVIIAKTLGGKGVPFMENSFEWHYWPLTEIQYNDAIRALTKKT